MSLRLRIILIYALLVLFSFSCVIWLIIGDVRPRYLQAVEESTVDTAEILASLLSGQLASETLSAETVRAVMGAAMEAAGRRDFQAGIYNIVKRRVSLRVYVTDARGILLYDSGGLARPGEDYSQWRDVYLTLRGRYGARSTRAIPDEPSSQVLFVAAPILKDGRICGVLSVGKPTNSITFLIAIAQKRFILSLALVGATAIILGIGLSHWVTRPVRQLTAYANAIRAGNAGRPATPGARGTASPPVVAGIHRPPKLGPAEIGLLGTALAEMQARLEGKNYIEDYVRALTHELKSPLTGIKGAAEILRDQTVDPETLKFLDNMDSDAERMHQLVERMLQLSRLENVRSVNKTTFRADSFLGALAESFRPQLTGRSLHLALQIQDNLVLEGDELLLRQAVANLISNAVDFSPPGSGITVSARAAEHEIIITVRDQGAGIPEFAQDKVFDKFFSLSRPGGGKKSTGLGLPFVAEVITLHGGAVSLKSTAAGLEAAMSIPRAD